MSDHISVPVVGLIGGVGSGKSAVARCVSDRRRVPVIDGDRAGHDVLQLTHVREQIRQRFGDSVFNNDGHVDREKLGREVFGSTPAHRDGLADLESIVHPEIRQILSRRIEELKASQSCEAIVLDAAVLLEAGWNDLCNAVVFVDVPYEQRLQRVAEGRGWSEDDLHARESSQLPLDSKRQLADYFIDNSGSLEAAAAKLERILDHVRHNLP